MPPSLILFYLFSSDFLEVEYEQLSEGCLCMCAAVCTHAFGAEMNRRCRSCFDRRSRNNRTH